MKLLFTGGSDKYFHERPIASENWLFDLQLKDSAKTTIYIKGPKHLSFSNSNRHIIQNKFVEHNELNILFWGFIWVLCSLHLSIIYLFIYR